MSVVRVSLGIMAKLFMSTFATLHRLCSIRPKSVTTPGNRRLSIVPTRLVLGGGAFMALIVTVGSLAKNRLTAGVTQTFILCRPTVSYICLGLSLAPVGHLVFCCWRQSAKLG